MSFAHWVASKASPSLYYYAVDQKIRYLIETGRKDKALQLYNVSMASAANSFADKNKQNDVLQRLKDRQRAYDLLGVRVPEFLMQSEVWLSGQQKDLDDLKGKVVMLDFWATWCGPCVEGIPGDEGAARGICARGPRDPRPYALLRRVVRTARGPCGGARTDQGVSREARNSMGYSSSPTDSRYRSSTEPCCCRRQS